jgi:hypothetical protein
MVGIEIGMLRGQCLDRRIATRNGTPAQERWLFPGTRPGKPMTTRQLNRLFHQTAEAAGIKKSVTLHALRHYVAFRTMSRTFCFNVVFCTNICNPPRHSPAPPSGSLLNGRAVTAI